MYKKVNLFDQAKKIDKIFYKIWIAVFIIYNILPEPEPKPVGFSKTINN